MAEAGFAVLDFETTGIPGRPHERVVEIGIVHLSFSGEEEGRWETLINPNRDMGPQHIHKISAAEVLNAPTFEKVAMQFADMLNGRVLVAHNAFFEQYFLRSEFSRAKMDYVSLSGYPAFCTKQFAGGVLSLRNTRLHDCLSYFSIESELPEEVAHQALADASATSYLFREYLKDSRSSSQAKRLIEDLSSQAQSHARSFRLSPMPIAHNWLPRNADSQPVSFLERITRRIPDLSSTEDQRQYLDFLDTCLIDHHLSLREQNALVSLAESLRIGQDTAEALHRQYYQLAVGIAWEDGVLSAAEKADLSNLAAVLHLQEETTQRLSATAEVAVTEGFSIRERYTLQKGDTLVLTGEMSQARSDWKRILERLGIIVAPNVTKKTTLLVAADIDTSSGKGQKAALYGVPVVDENMLTKLVEEFQTLY